MKEALDIIYNRILNRKKFFLYSFLFITFILTAEKKFIGVPKKAIIFTTLIVFPIILLWDKKKIENNVLVVTLIFGIIFSVITPVFEVWDEPAHFTRVEYISSGHLFLTNNKKDHFVSKDINKLEEISRYTSRKKAVLPNTFEVKLWDYKHDSEEEYQFRVPVTNAYGTVAYLPSLLGFNIGKLISNGNLGVMFYLGRIFNAIFYSLCAFLAVKLSKRWKHILAFFAMQPLLIYISGSFNQDAFSYGILLLAISFFFRMIQDVDEKVDNKDILFFILLCALMAFTKLPFIVFAGLVFFIPYRRFEDSKSYIMMLLGIVFVILVSGIWFIYYSKVEGLPPLADNVDSGEQINFILSNPKEFISLLFSSMFETITKYTQLSAFAWDRQGSEVLGLVNLVTIGIIMMFPMKKVDLVSRWTKFGIVFISLLVTILIYLSMYLTWTSVGDTHISGVQGRYFVGIIILLPVVLNSAKYLGNIKENKYTYLAPQVMAVILLIWSFASRVGVYY